MTSRMDERTDGLVADEVAWSTGASAGSRAGFWREIATGVTSGEAAIAIGVSPAAGARWFRERGGMPTFMATPLIGRYLSFKEREEIALLKAQGAGDREIARALGRDKAI